MAATADQAAWVQRVLGVSIGGAAPSARASGAKSGTIRFLDTWRDAKEAVDAGIAALQDRMRKHPYAPLARIADAGLNGITGRQAVGMMAAMMEADKSVVAAAPKTRAAVAAMRGFLATDVAAAIDDNPFHVDVSLRQTFGAALDTIEQHLNA